MLEKASFSLIRNRVAVVNRENHLSGCRGPSLVLEHRENPSSGFHGPGAVVVNHEFPSNGFRGLCRLGQP